MSRSNGTTDRHPAHAQPHAQGRAAQQADPGQSLPWHQLAPDAQHAPQQSGLFAAPPPPPPPQQNQQANQQAPQGYYPAQPGYPAGSDPYYGHYFTGAPQGQPAQGQPSQGQQPQGYAPQHAPQHAPQGYGQQLDPAIYAQAQAQAAAAARAAGFSPQTQQQPYTDPRSGYDLAGYATQAPSYQPQGYPPPGPQNHGYPPQGAPTYGSQQYDQQHYDQQQYDQYDPHAAQLQSGQQPDTHADDDEDYDDEPAEPKGRGRGLVVVASLIGAIALGAGLAYGYKKFGGGASAGKPAVLKAEQTPAKKAATSGDQKTAGRLDQPPPAVVAADQSASANAGTPGGPRVVQTIPISPAGTVVAGLNPPPAAQPTPPLRPTISVPGVQLDGGA
ncbi:MAG: hypothetical protein HOO99_16965, partial [Hyphomicrobiaceae bacterium]|nr:hypothetical protein [Hyphomicrobiaceae bacterium]